MYYEDLLENAVFDEYKPNKTNTLGDLNKFDKHYVKYTIPFNDTWTDGKYYKRLTIENYGTGTTGSLIRNAVTGKKYDIRVGSADEDILYKVNDVTARNGRREPLFLYYDSPEQFERHRFTRVSPDVKQKWLQRASDAQKRLNSSKK